MGLPNLTFQHPLFLLGLLVLPLLAYLEWRTYKKRNTGFQFSDIRLLKSQGMSIWTKLTRLPHLLRYTALALCIIALARPQDKNTVNEQFAEGVDILLVLDTSTSMKAQDFKPNRFIAAKDVAREFIENRVSDRVGLIVFAAQAFTQVPLTLDYEFLQRLMDDVNVGIIEDGTAIGSAIATAVNRLKDSAAKSKVVILLTDGQNNRGEIDPSTAADVAASMNVRVYTIGVGAKGTAPYVRDDPFLGRRTQQIPVEIDEDMLQSVAEKTGGQYFRATNKIALRSIYEEIGELEKTKVEERIYTDYKELFHFFLWPALLLILFELALLSTKLRKFP